MKTIKVPDDGLQYVDSQGSPILMIVPTDDGAIMALTSTVDADGHSNSIVISVGSNSTQIITQGKDSRAIMTSDETGGNFRAQQVIDDVPGKTMATMGIDTNGGNVIVYSAAGSGGAIIGNTLNGGAINVTDISDTLRGVTINTTDEGGQITIHQGDEHITITEPMNTQAETAPGTVNPLYWELPAYTANMPLLTNSIAAQARNGVLN